MVSPTMQPINISANIGKNILSEKEKPSPCNCRDATSCPLYGSCQHKNFVYSTRFLTSDIKQDHPHYIGLTEHTFKNRLYKRNSSFKYESNGSSTELSNFMWGWNKDNVNVNLDWSILDNAQPYFSDSRKYILCITVKYHIIVCTKNVPSKRNELLTKRRHENNPILQITKTLLHNYLFKTFFPEWS